MQVLERTEAVQVIFDFPQDVEQKINNLPSHARLSMNDSLLTEVKNLLRHYETIESEEFTVEQLASIDRGLADIEAGRVIPEAEMKNHFKELKNKFKVAIARQNEK